MTAHIRSADAASSSGVRRHSAARAASEAQAAAQALGGRLAAFEIGNEPNFYRTETSYETTFNSYVAAIRAKVPTAIFDGPGESEDSSRMAPFAAHEKNGALVMPSMHRYISSSRTATIPGMLASNPSRFEGDETAIASVKSANHIPLWCMTEANFYSRGGAAGVSDVEAPRCGRWTSWTALPRMMAMGGTSTEVLRPRSSTTSASAVTATVTLSAPAGSAQAYLLTAPSFCFEGDHHRRLRGERQRVVRPVAHVAERFRDTCGSQRLHGERGTGRHASGP